MNKTELVNVVAAETQLSKKDVDAVVSATLKAITDALKEGDKVQLIGFGNFEVKAAPAREGRNPKTGETITIPASKKPVFSASKVLKEQVNG
ncbi:MAG: HU family DNA-binding protein [Clostridia bacterium]|nr:HU family DNA-binding protein [Clostridia bacterium]